MNFKPQIDFVHDTPQAINAEMTGSKTARKGLLNVMKHVYVW
jgi:hypothetical protein